MKKKDKKSYIINDKGKKEYIKDIKSYKDLDSLKKKMSFSFDIKLMLITPLIFFILNFIVLNTLYSEVLKESVFVSKNIPYLLVSVFIILWTIYLAIDFEKKPSRLYLFSGVFCLLESIFFLIIGIQMLYFPLGKKVIIYIITGIGVYLFNILFNAFIAYLFIKKGYSEKNLVITKFRIANIVFTFAIALILNISLKLNFNEYITLLYPKFGETNVLSYASMVITLSQLIVGGTINIYKYIYMEK